MAEEQVEGYIDKELQKQKDAGREKNGRNIDGAWRRSHIREVLTRQGRRRGKL